MFFAPGPEATVNAPEGFEVQDVATPPCRVQEIDVVEA